MSNLGWLLTYEQERRVHALKVVVGRLSLLCNPNADDGNRSGRDALVGECTCGQKSVSTSKRGHPKRK